MYLNVTNVFSESAKKRILNETRDVELSELAKTLSNVIMNILFGSNVELNKLTKVFGANLESIALRYW